MKLNCLVTLIQSQNQALTGIKLFFYVMTFKMLYIKTTNKAKIS